MNYEPGLRAEKGCGGRRGEVLGQLKAFQVYYVSSTAFIVGEIRMARWNARECVSTLLNVNLIKYFF